MGEANITTNIGNSGQLLFNFYQINNFEPSIEDTTEDYVQEDTTKFLLTHYSNWLSTTAITKFFDEYLQSKTPL